MSNTIGDALKVTIFGQSHSKSMGVVMEGLPAGIDIHMDRLQAFMRRRAPGSADYSSARKEADLVSIVAGLNERGQTCGAPLCALIENTDARPQDYDALRDVPRPGHADFTARVKYGEAHDIRGGGAFSGRMTAPLCIAGAICMQLPAMGNIRVAAHISAIGGAKDRPFNPMGECDAVLDELAKKPFPVLDDAAGERMRGVILDAKAAEDSVGGVIELTAMNVPSGLGEPMFCGVENALSRAFFGIPGVRGVEFGMGFAAAEMRGSEHNDSYSAEDGEIRTLSNCHGGILGGLTSGMPILARVALKPTPSIASAQKSVSFETGESVDLRVSGRHDPCIVPRAVPCVEAAALIVLANFMMNR